MVILGLNSFLHSSSASLMIDGRVIENLEEERLTRQKYTHEFPRQSINWLLKENNISFSDIDVIGFSWNPYMELFHGAKHLIRYFPQSLYSLFHVTTDTPIIPRIKNICNVQSMIHKYYPEYNKHTKFHYISHHQAHAANAFFSSPYEEAAILVVDGLGDNYDSISVWKGEGNRIKKIKSIKFPHSLGTFYLCFVTHLGFLETSGPGKVMGLSSYGSERFVVDFQDMIKVGRNMDCRINLKKTLYHLYGRHRTVSKEFEEIIGPRRKPEEEITHQHEDIAYALQKSFEHGMIEIIKQVKEVADSHYLCIGGGVALNSVANGIISNSGYYKHVFVSSAPDDSGTSLGAAQFISHHMLSSDRRSEKNNCSYSGPEFTNQQIRNCLEQYDGRISYEKCEDYIYRTAQLIAAGSTVGWFQGRMEYGPRALGNRSILADPRIPDIKERLNKKIKFREEFRPYAATILEEEADKYFIRSNQTLSPHMSFVYSVRKEREKEIIGTVHVDGTVRIQTVSDSDNAVFRKLIEDFYKLTGVPMLINTSFNVNREPICCRPEDAIKCLLHSGLDYLVMENYIVSKK